MYIEKFGESDKDKHKIYAPQVPGNAVKRLNPKGWINDELITFCSKNLYSLFCGEHSKFSTLVFPIFFLTKLFQHQVGNLIAICNTHFISYSVLAGFSPYCFETLFEDGDLGIAKIGHSFHGLVAHCSS